MKCALKRCQKPFIQTVPWMKFCSKPCTDRASQLRRIKLLQAGRKAVKMAGMS